jgi:hypothetical protein
MKISKIIKFIYTLLIASQCCYAFNAPTNDTLTLRLINHSSKTLVYTGAKKINVGNSFFVTPTTILPGGAAIVVGVATPYTDLSANLPFQDETRYTHLLHIVDPRMITFKQPTFSIYNKNLISFVKPTSFVKNENQDPSSLAYSSTTVIIQDTATSNKDHPIA